MDRCGPELFPFQVQPTPSVFSLGFADVSFHPESLSLGEHSTALEDSHACTRAHTHTHTHTV